LEKERVINMPINSQKKKKKKKKGKKKKKARINHRAD